MIATELISGPSVMFLDGASPNRLIPLISLHTDQAHLCTTTTQCAEPTSGLDSFQAQSVVSALKALAGDGRTIITVIHQPRSSIFQVRGTCNGQL